MEAEERLRQHPVHIDEEKTWREQTQRRRGWGVGVGRIDERDDVIREQREHERSRNADEGQERERFLDHRAQLGPRVDRQP